MPAVQCYNFVQKSRKTKAERFLKNKKIIISRKMRTSEMRKQTKEGRWYGKKGEPAKKGIIIKIPGQQRENIPG